MSTRVAINGLGRIGRSILKGIIDEPALELVAVNDLADVENLSYLLRFDTVYGRYSKPIAVEQGDLVVAGRKLRTLSSRDPSALPWKQLGIELVFECTGALTRREDLEKHVRAGARFVLLSAPSKDKDVETLVHGANAAGPASSIISCASKVHTEDFDYKGYTHHASKDEPQYEIRSDKSEHVAAHKGSALHKVD
jgi:glyceraldehyde 3-phosphate dehydrogenase